MVSRGGLDPGSFQCFARMSRDMKTEHFCDPAVDVAVDVIRCRFTLVGTSMYYCAEMNTARCEIQYAHALHMWMTTSLGSSHQVVNARVHAWVIPARLLLCRRRAPNVEERTRRVVLIVGRTRFLRRASVWSVSLTGGTELLLVPRYSSTSFLASGCGPECGGRAFLED